MSQNNQETTDNAKQQGSRKEGRRRRDQEQPSRSYKHVTLERKRPQLTKDGTAQGKPSQKRKSRQQDFSSPKKDPNATLKVIPLGGLDAIGKRRCRPDVPR